ncbi:uncharacterized protein EDB93DRAFT_1186558 [Suillus bovinus]|uniref:uncharacterized protein n=1 Tax=Suillus bovinus TaxID=48563 RepID=UPI001B880539|nr:uncharacterized protein EDB93DRAFT_1186558 [Suillus bovinus]KAG2127621.1 hypothetical protein EDB93DRAFT_1186558 [Suillus bovinus]
MANILIRYDLEQFKWKPFKGEGVRNGLLLVHEICNRYLKGDQTLFFGVTIDLHDTMSITKLSSSAQECWSWLRFQVPTIASSILNESDYKLPMLIYTTASPQEISRWVQRTLIIHPPSHIDLNQLRINEVPNFSAIPYSSLDCVDGAGLKIVVNRYLAQLAKVLSDSYSASDVLSAWGASTKVLFIFSSDLFSLLIIDHKDKYGLALRPKDTKWPKTCRAEVLFTREESERILAASKISGFTLTHLGRFGSETRATSRLCSWHFHSQDSVSAFLSADGSVLPLDRDILLRVADIAKGQYRALIELPAGLSCMPQGCEAFAMINVHAASTNMYCYSFSSDGKGENYLNHTFADDTGKPVLTVNKFFTSLNRLDPGPFFRLSSWGGVIDLGADYNSNIVKTEDVMNYLNQWKRFLLLILDN